ncbi:MAG: OmpA family protein [Polyangiaceae bacterium]
MTEDRRRARQIIAERRAAFVAAALGAAGCASTVEAPAGTPMPAPPSASAAPSTATTAANTPPPTAPEPSAAEAPPGPVVVCLSLRIMPQIRFRQHRLEPEPASREVVSEAAKILVENPELALGVEGHAGADEASTLALARARRVRDLLVAEGVEATRLCPTSHGAREPLVADPAAPANRRVELHLRDPKEPCADP